MATTLINHTESPKRKHTLTSGPFSSVEKTSTEENASVRVRDSLPIPVQSSFNNRSPPPSGACTTPPQSSLPLKHPQLNRPLAINPDPGQVAFSVAFPGIQSSCLKYKKAQPSPPLYSPAQPSPAHQRLNKTTTQCTTQTPTTTQQEQRRRGNAGLPTGPRSCPPQPTTHHDAAYVDLTAPPSHSSDENL